VIHSVKTSQYLYNLPALPVVFRASLVLAFSFLVSFPAAAVAFAEFSPSCHPSDYATLQTS